MFEQWIERAGPQVRSPGRGVGAAAGAAADVIAELIAGRMLPTGALIAAAVSTGTAEQPNKPATSPLEQSAMQIRAVLDRIAARRLARGERLPPDART